MGTQYQFTVVKMKLIVLIALIGLVAAIPNPCPEEEYGPANGLRIPDYQPYVPKEKYGPTNGLRIPDYHPYVEKEKYGPTNGLRIPDHYYQKRVQQGLLPPKMLRRKTLQKKIMHQETPQRRLRQKKLRQGVQSPLLLTR